MIFGVILGWKIDVKFVAKRNCSWDRKKTSFRPHKDRPKRCQDAPGRSKASKLEPTWPQEGSQNRSKIDQNPSLGASKTQDPPRGTPGKENDTKIEEKTINFDAEDMQKKASIPLCFSTVLGGKIGGAVPKKGEHSVFFFVRMQCNAMQYNTLHYNAMQCNAMQCNGTAQR